MTDREHYVIQDRPSAAGSAALNAPLRSAERAALDIAVAALQRFRHGQSELEVIGSVYAGQTLDRIAAILPGAVKR